MTSRPFAFDTEFDAAGDVVRASDFRPIKRAYSPAEVEALVSQARLEGREAALAETAALQAQALSVIAQGVAQSAGTLMTVAQAHREGAAEIARRPGASSPSLPTSPTTTAPPSATSTPSARPSGR